MPDRLQAYNLLNRLGMETVLDEGFLTSVDISQPIALLQEAYGSVRASGMLHKMLALDLKFTLADNDLRKVGGMCELAGMEVGYPLLREDLVNFAARLPANYKVRGLKLRYFFKEALRDFLPLEVIKKEKHGFGLPFGAWVLTHSRLKELVWDSLTGLKGRGIVRKAFVDELMGQRLGEHSNYYGTLVWVLTVLEQWFRNE